PQVFPLLTIAAQSFRPLPTKPGNETRGLTHAAIVTEFGASRDALDGTVTWLLPSRSSDFLPPPGAGSSTNDAPRESVPWFPWPDASAASPSKFHEPTRLGSPEPGSTVTVTVDEPERSPAAAVSRST